MTKKRAARSTLKAIPPSDAFAISLVAQAPPDKRERLAAEMDSHLRPQSRRFIRSLVRSAIHVKSKSSKALRSKLSLMANALSCMDVQESKDKQVLYYEKITSGTKDCVLASEIRPATEAEIEEAKRLHALGKCPCTIVVDTDGWPYTERHCAICGADLGLV